MSLAPTNGESVWLAEKVKPLWGGKNPFWARLTEKPLVEGKKSKLIVICGTYINVLEILKHKCLLLLRGRLDDLWFLVRLTFAICICVLLSHHENGYFHVKPWLSYHMNFVMIQVSHPYRLNVYVGQITCVHYTSTFTNHVTRTFYEGILRSVWCCLWSPICCVCVQQRECQTIVPIFLYCITTLGGRHCIVGVWVNSTLVVVRDTQCH